MKYKQEIFIFILLVFLIFSISVVSANQSLDDTSNDELVLLSNVNEPVNTMNVNVDTVQGNDSADLENNAETDESENGQHQKNVLGASNSEESLLGANIVVSGYTIADIQTAIRAANSGDSIFLGGKTYTGTASNIEINNKSIFIYGGSTTTDTKHATINVNTYQTNTIFNFTCDNNNNNYILRIKNVDFNQTVNVRHKETMRAIYAKYYNKVEILNCNFDGWSQVTPNTASAYPCCIHINGDNTLVDNCNFNKITTTRILYLDGDNNTVQNCKFNNSTVATSIACQNSHHPLTLEKLKSLTGIENLGDIDKREGLYFKGINNRFTNLKPVVNDKINLNTGGLNGFAGNLGIAYTSACFFTTFINNYYCNITALDHGCAYCLHSGFNTIINDTAINCTAPHGAAINSHYGYDRIENVKIYNCTANETYGGGIQFDGPNSTVINCTLIDNHANTNGGGIHISGNNTTIIDCKLINNTAVTYGGGIFLSGHNTNISNSYFDRNNASYGSGITVYGKYANVETSNFTNHNSKYGTIYIVGDNATVYDSIFENNNATYGSGIYIRGTNSKINKSNLINNTATIGGGIYITGNNSQISSTNFIDNTATKYGGAAYVYGSGSSFTSNIFTGNNATPNENDDSVGLGGAIFVKGNNTNTFGNTFSHNEARNGSALYTDGVDFYLENDIFKENRAFSYLLLTTVDPSSSYYRENETNVTVVHKGGDNIINAIYNKADFDKIHFKNVTYNRTGTIESINTGSEWATPVDGATRTTPLYQDDREDLQLIKLTITNVETGEKVLEYDSLFTDIYGNITLIFPKATFKVGNYSVFAEHPTDWNYRYINGSTKFERLYALEDNKTVSNETPYYGAEIDFNLTIHNDAEVVYNDNINSNGGVNNV